MSIRLADAKINFTWEEFNVTRFKMQASRWSQFTKMPASLIWRHYKIVRYNEGVTVDLAHIRSRTDLIAAIRFLGTFNKSPWHRAHTFRIYENSIWGRETIQII